MTTTNNATRTQMTTTTMITCPECGGYGSIDARTFGDHGRHSCYRCGETGLVPAPTPDQRRQALKRDCKYGYASPARPGRPVPFHVFLRDPECEEPWKIATAFTLAYAWWLADLNSGDYVEPMVLDHAGRRMARPNSANIRTFVPITDDELPF